jgi:hypothetical protein
VIANVNNLKPQNVISFSSKTIPVLAVLRKNSLENRNTQIIYTGELPEFFDAEIVKNIYGYHFELKVDQVQYPAFSGSTIFISQQEDFGTVDLTDGIFLSVYMQTWEVLVVNGEQNETYISDIQHVRRRETIAMTPSDSFTALKSLVTHSPVATTKKQCGSR